MQKKSFAHYLWGESIYACYAFARYARENNNIVESAIAGVAHTSISGFHAIERSPQVIPALMHPGVLLRFLFLALYSLYRDIQP